MAVRGLCDARGDHHGFIQGAGLKGRSFPRIYLCALRSFILFAPGHAYSVRAKRGNGNLASVSSPDNSKDNENLEISDKESMYGAQISHDRLEAATAPP